MRWTHLRRYEALMFGRLYTVDWAADHKYKELDDPGKLMHNTTVHRPFQFKIIENMGKNCYPSKTSGVDE